MTTTSQPAPASPRSVPATVVLLMAFAVAGCGTIGTVDAEDARGRAMQASGSLVSPIPTELAPAVPPSVPGTSEAAPDVTATAVPTPAITPGPRRARFAMDLYRKGDYVAQYTFDWCVGASLQMALNMTTATDDTTRARQRQLWELAQARSSSPFGGANPVGWTAALNDLGIGPYLLVSVPDLDSALRLAARALRQTKRPVGLVMWRGRHAWVMSGFVSNGDPAIFDDAAVTGIRVLDPLYPHGSRTWGPSPRPDALITPATLAKQFVIRDHGRANLGVPPGYLLVLPTTARSGPSGA